MMQALPPVEPGTRTHRGVFSDGESPGGIAAPPINWLTSVTNGVQTGVIPAGWMAGVCHIPEGRLAPQIYAHERDPLNAVGEPMARPATDKILRSRPDQMVSWPFDIPMGVTECEDTEMGALAWAVRELDNVSHVAVARYAHAWMRARGVALPGAAVPVSVGAGMLFEARTAGGAGGGVLHVADRAVTAAAADGTIVRGGTRFTSAWGGPVAVGPGMSADGPDGHVGEVAAAGTAWMWISGNVDYALSPIEALNTQPSMAMGQTNRVASALVERRAMVRFNDSDVFAVLVDLDA